MNGEEYVEWLKSLVELYPDNIIVVVHENKDEDEIPYEAHDMDKSVHYRYQCPHHNLHGTHDVELELDGHHVVMRGYINGERNPMPDGTWPFVHRCESDDEALRVYLRARQSFVDNDFEIVDA